MNSPIATTRVRPSTIVLVVLCLAQFMLIVDVVIVNVALPQIRTDLDIPDGRLQLVAVGYTLTFGSLLIVLGRAGDLFGRRRFLIVGLVVFTIASLTTGLAQEEWQLLGSRVGQGIGAAFVAPAALALLTTTFSEGDSRNRALGYWGAVGSAGAIAGQLLGGVITHVVGWRAIFLINVPFGIIAIIGAMRFIDDDRVRRSGNLDLRGAATLVAGLFAGTLALTLFAEGSSLGAGMVAGVAAVVALAMFVRSERRQREPLIDTVLLRRRNVALANILLAVNAGMLGATLFFTTLYLQVILGYSPLDVGAAFAPITLLILLISPRAGKLTTRLGARRLLTVGFALLAAGMLLLARLPDDGSYLVDVLPGLLLLAFGSGLSYAPIFITGTSGVPGDRQGVASGLLNSAQELGAAVGVTILGAVAAATTARHAADSLTAGYRLGLLAAATGVALSIVMIRRLPTHADSPAEVDADPGRGPAKVP